MTNQMISRRSLLPIPGIMLAVNPSGFVAGMKQAVAALDQHAAAIRQAELAKAWQKRLADVDVVMNGRFVNDDLWVASP